MAMHVGDAYRRFVLKLIKWVTGTIVVTALGFSGLIIYDQFAHSWGYPFWSLFGALAIPFVSGFIYLCARKILTGIRNSRLPGI
jgi:hypothetical protein